MSVQEMRHYQQFVTNLENTIHHYQKLVIMKRNEMNEKQNDLTEKNIELKKFEKMKEKQLEMFLIRNKAVSFWFMLSYSFSATFSNSDTDC